MTDSEYETDSDSTAETIEEKIAASNEIKAKGNESFKAKDFESAKKFYEEAIERLDGAKPELEAQFHNNAAAACLTMNEYFGAIRHADEVLFLEPNNEKALFRRAQARLKCGYPVEAKQDAAALLKIQPNSTEARKIIKEANTKITESKNKEKQAFSGLFAKTAGMYTDVDKKQMDRKKEKYEKAMKQREAKGLERIDMETWENDLIERKQARKEARNNSENENSTLSTQPSAKGDELDVEDEKIIMETKKMGYCYFKEHADKVEQELKSFKSQHSAPHTPGVTETESDNVKKNKAISSWNANGTTYEEKDVSKWASEAFDYYIRSTPTNLENCQATFTILDINDLDGDANISVIRGTKRYMFEFNCTINLNIKLSNEEQFNVKLLLQDISSELVSGETWKDEMSCSLTSIDKQARPKVSENLEFFKEALCTSIGAFFEKFKQID